MDACTSHGNGLCFVDRHVLFSDVSAIPFLINNSHSFNLHLYLCVYPNVFTQYVVQIKTLLKGVLSGGDYVLDINRGTII